MKKYIIIFSLIILIVLVIIVFKYNIPNKNEIVLGREFTLKINQKANFNNELNIQLKNMSDSRCPSDAVCGWQGEIDITININNIEYRLGSELKKTVDIQNTIYAIEYLPEYNVKTVTLKIYKK